MKAKMPAIVDKECKAERSAITENWMLFYQSGQTPTNCIL